MMFVMCTDDDVDTPIIRRRRAGNESVQAENNHEEDTATTNTVPAIPSDDEATLPSDTEGSTVPSPDPPIPLYTMWTREDSLSSADALFGTRSPINPGSVRPGPTLPNEPSAPPATATRTYHPSIYPSFRYSPTELTGYAYQRRALGIGHAPRDDDLMRNTSNSTQASSSILPVTPTMRTGLPRYYDQQEVGDSQAHLTRPVFGSALLYSPSDNSDDDDAEPVPPIGHEHGMARAGHETHKGEGKIPRTPPSHYRLANIIQNRESTLPESEVYTESYPEYIYAMRDSDSLEVEIIRGDQDEEAGPSTRTYRPEITFANINRPLPAAEQQPTEALGAAIQFGPTIRPAQPAQHARPAYPARGQRQTTPGLPSLASLGPRPRFHTPPSANTAWGHFPVRASTPPSTWNPATYGYAQQYARTTYPTHTVTTATLSGWGYAPGLAHAWGTGAYTFPQNQYAQMNPRPNGPYTLSTPPRMQYMTNEQAYGYGQATGSGFGYGYGPGVGYGGQTNGLSPFAEQFVPVHSYHPRLTPHYNDWICPLARCGYANFARNRECRMCGNRKMSLTEAIELDAGTYEENETGNDADDENDDGQAGAGGSGGGNGDEGNDDNNAVASGSGSGSGSDRPIPPLGSAGDWVCPGCGEMNWRRRSVCFRCCPLHPTNFESSLQSARRQLQRQANANLNANGGGSGN